VPAKSSRSLDISQFELVWLAGLLEGEGYFGMIKNHTGGKVYRYARVGVTMTDRDVIERVARLWQTKVFVVKPSGVSKKTAYRAHIFGQRAVQLMRRLFSHMGERRQRQMTAVFEEEALRPDPNVLHRNWSCKAYEKRKTNRLGQLTSSR